MNAWWMRAMVVSGLLLATATPALAQGKLGRAQRTLADAKRTLDYMENTYLKKEALQLNLPVVSRFNDARVAYELGEYGKAAPLLYDVLARTDESFGSYRAAVFYLGDSLLQQRNFVGARGYFERIIKMGDGPFFQESLQRLLEVAYQTRNYEGVDKVYAMLDGASASKLSTSVNYLRGKTLYAQERWAEARVVFEDVATKDPRLAPQAKYYVGVTYVSEAKLDEAKKVFEALTQGTPATPEALRVKQLSQLSLGRLLFEQGKYEAAIDRYNRIPNSDPNFVRAMYEATWALVQLKEYVLARENVGLLFFADPSPAMYSKAMLLRADISLRIKDYDQALESFRDILKRYDPVKEQLDAFVAKHADLRGFFMGMVREDLELEVPEDLPIIKTEYTVQSPKEWLSEGKLIKKTTLLIGDVATMKKDIEGALKTLDELDARLASNSRVKSFPTMAEGFGRAVEVEASLVGLRRELLDAELALVKPMLPGADAARVTTLLGELQALAEQEKNIPRTIDDLNARQDASDKEFQAYRRKLDEVGYAISNLNKELEAVDLYMKTQSTPLKPDELAKVTKQKAEYQEQLRGLEAERSKLQADVDVARAKAGGVVTIAERQTRLAYRKKMADISAVLSPHHGRVASGDLGTILTVRRDIAPLEARVEGYYTSMFSIVDRKLEDVKKQLVAERTMLTDELKTLDVLVRSSRQVAGGLAYQNFVGKKEQFEKTILRADVGQIDVLYQKKEDSTNEINKLFQQRTQELKTLQESFDDLR